MSSLKTSLDDTGLLIVRELYQACEMLGADPGLLSAIAAGATHSMTPRSSRR